MVVARDSGEAAATPAAGGVDNSKGQLNHQQSKELGLWMSPNPKGAEASVSDGFETTRPGQRVPRKWGWRQEPDRDAKSDAVQPKPPPPPPPTSSSLMPPPPPPPPKKAAKKEGTLDH